MNTTAYFSPSYPAARRAFLDAASAAGARLSSHVNPAARGPAGEELATDVAWLGPADAARVLVTISGTHGAEGFAGSGIQVGSFRAGFARELGERTALLAIHAINPYGFAWMRRVTEENVDLNRNFVAHDTPLPEKAGYATHGKHQDEPISPPSRQLSGGGPCIRQPMSERISARRPPAGRPFPFNLSCSAVAVSAGLACFVIGVDLTTIVP